MTAHPTPAEASALLRQHARKAKLPPGDDNFDDAASLIERLEKDVSDAIREATDQRYMKEAYWWMLGPVGLAVAGMWVKKRVHRVHHSWGPEAYKLSGEERAQAILDMEEAAKTAVPIDHIDGL